MYPRVLVRISDGSLTLGYLEPGEFDYYLYFIEFKMSFSLLVMAALWMQETDILDSSCLRK